MFLLVHLSPLACWHWQLWVGIPCLLLPCLTSPLRWRQSCLPTSLLYMGEICDCKGPKVLPPPWGFVWMGSASTFVSSWQAWRKVNGFLSLILFHTALKFMLSSLVSTWPTLQVFLCLADSYLLLAWAALSLLACLAAWPVAWSVGKPALLFSLRCRGICWLSPPISTFLMEQPVPAASW